MTAQAGSASSFYSQRTALRRRMRLIRQSLTPAYRRYATERVMAHLLRLGYLQPGKRLGIYLALPEELSLSIMIRRARQMRCQLFIPVITSMRRRQMVFVPFLIDSQVRTNRWGITELDRRIPPVSAPQLDAILVPLVAFDANGHRLGMGGGFYDRYCVRRADNSWQYPKLTGIAFAAQQVDSVPVAAHDVALDCVITERGVIRPLRPHSE